MNSPTSVEAKPKASLSDYLAAERTLLAWVRTGVALMGFGFVVARFGLFLQEIQVAQHASSVQSFGFSLWLGTALIGAGVLVNALSGWHHARLVQALNRGEVVHSHSSILPVAVALFLALVGTAMAIYLISVRNSIPTHSGNSKGAPMTLAKGRGIVDTASNHSVDETVAKLKKILEAKGAICSRWSTTAVKQRKSE